MASLCLPRTRVYVILVMANFLSKTKGGAMEWNLEKYQHHQVHRSKTGSSHMFVLMYEHENFKGKVHQQTITRSCTNVSQEYDNWASSVNLNNHCVTLCDKLDCQGICMDFYPNQKGMKRLSQYGLNDKVSSVKYCYRFR